MPVVSALLLVLLLALAVGVGPQTRAWTWGPALLPLAGAVAAGLPAIWRRGRSMTDFGLITTGFLVAAWFAWRAGHSPVTELGNADLLLLAAAAGTFLTIRSLEGNVSAGRIVSWGVALLLLANVLAVARQVVDPSFSPIFHSRAAPFPSGFYAHYNEAANFLIACAMLCAAFALFGKHSALARVIFALIALGGLVAIHFTHSRGGILGAGLAAGLFWLGSVIHAKHRNSRWFAAGIIGIPVIAVLLIIGVTFAWQSSQALRQPGFGIREMFDNTSRLYFLGAAISCIALHPLAGGGSRSFSWEYFRFAENKLQGDMITHIPEQVHNELLQSATDYGIIGASLLMALLGALALISAIRINFPGEETERGDFTDAWRLGGLAALAGMFVQSCFSFVFHLLPGAMLLGLCLGMLARSPGNTLKPAHLGLARILLTVASLAVLAVLLPFGWKGLQVTRILWPTHFSKTPLTSSETKIDALSAAIAIWPQAVFYEDRGNVLQESAAQQDGNLAKRYTESAVADYEMALKLHPYNPSPAINLANVLSLLGRDAEAEQAYSLAVQLQGGMEPSFRAHFSLANHLLMKGTRQFNVNYPDEALATIEIAAAEMEQSAAQMHWVIREMEDSRVSAQESLGAAREANGDYKGAMQAYEFATTLPGGLRARYRIGILQGKMAAAAWSARKPAEALYYFKEAKRHISAATELPVGVTPAQRVEYLNYLEETIKFLEGAKIAPLEKPPE